jgi:ATP-binding cassette subfamily B protein
MFTACALYISGGITLSYCLMFIISAFLVYSEMEQMGDGAFLARKITTELNRIETVTDMPEMDTSANILVPENYDIELRDVSFAYDSRRVIDHVSAKVAQGTTCAIVGPSGSGKTTLCNLIARFWDVQEGQVLIGGQNVKNYTRHLCYISMDKSLSVNEPIENQFASATDALMNRSRMLQSAPQCHESSALRRL